MEAVTAAKLTAAVVQNRDTILKFVGIIALAVAFPVILLSTGMLELVSAFTPDGTVVSTSEMDITSTSVYRAVKEATGPYYDDLWNEMGHKRAEIMAEHTETVTLVGENGQPYETEKCDVIVSRHMNYLADAYLIAYLVCAEGMDVNTARIDTGTAYRFLDSIGEIVVIEANGEYQVTNSFLSMDEIRRMWFPDEAEGKKFVACCEAYSQFMEISQTQIDIEAGNWTNVDFSAISLMNVPLYLQYKGSWAATPYGDVAQSGKPGVRQPALPWYCLTSGRSRFCRMTSLHGQETVFMSMNRDVMGHIWRGGGRMGREVYKHWKESDPSA